MKFVRGKRQFKQERVWGLLLVTEPFAGVRTFGLIFGRSVWGFQWKLRKSKLKSGNGFARTSPRSGQNTGNR